MRDTETEPASAAIARGASADAQRRQSAQLHRHRSPCAERPELLQIALTVLRLQFNELPQGYKQHAVEIREQDSVPIAVKAKLLQRRLSASGGGGGLLEFISGSFRILESQNDGNKKKTLAFWPSPPILFNFEIHVNMRMGEIMMI
eukprot:scaffold162_cov275-Pinguiococcus_pyrenoidosus.AAC.10